MISRFVISCIILVPVSVFADEGTEFFEKKIRPVLVKKCYECHSADAGKYKGGLALDTREGIRKGGESGHGVVPGSTKESLVLDAIRYESFEMPPNGKLDDRVIQDFEKWIKMGAPDPREMKQANKNVKPIENEKAIDWEAGKNHWAFQQPTKHPAPSGFSKGAVQAKIDAFVRDRQRKNKIPHNPPADDRTLLRRLTFDIIGLPPTSEQTKKFFQEAKTDRQTAITNLVDELLASPQYGERWTALWLDVMRYAEDQAHIVGNNKTLFYPNAFLYRDWVIQSFNEDMPYNEFVKLQLAADFATPDDNKDDIALGFIGLGPKYYGRGSPAVQADEYEDRVDTVSRGLLGLTVACARCHDHKYDPISTEDYYGLAGVFASTAMFNRPMNGKEGGKGGQAKNPEEAVHIIIDRQPVDLNVMIRGDAEVKGELVPRRFLTILSPDLKPQKFTNKSGRLELAEAIVDEQNPLTARVIVNRIWAEYFGEGLVATNSNFGALGNKPTFPKLLDDLSVRFMENGWSLKWLHREIVLSATYQQSSDINEAATQLDEANETLWRMNRRKLTVEQWRDSLLRVSGELKTSVGGASIDPSNPEETRRTVYASRSRFQQNPMLVRFDFPDSNSHAANRSETTTPLQKLFVMNSPFAIRRADELSQRIQNNSDNNKVRIQFAYQLLYSREPTLEETELGEKFLKQADWDQYAHVLLASNEMFILD